MSAKKGTLAQQLVDEFDFSGDTAGISVAINVSEEECTTLGADGATYEPILPNMKTEYNGYLSAAAATGTMEAELKSRLGVAGSYVATLFGTDVLACPAYVQGTFGADMNISSPAKGLITLSGRWGMGNEFSRGIRIFAGELDATGDQDAVDLGAAGSDGGECYLFVQDIQGTATDAVILVESSATEDGSYAEEAEFEFSDVGAYKAAMTGTVNRWVRVNLDDLGGADAITFVMIVCVNGVTQ